MSVGLDAKSPNHNTAAKSLRTDVDCVSNSHAGGCHPAAVSPPRFGVFSWRRRNSEVHVRVKVPDSGRVVNKIMISLHIPFCTFNTHVAKKRVKINVYFA